MSSPATAAWIERWERKTLRKPRALALIEWTHPGAQQFRVATELTQLADGSVWEPFIVGQGKIHSPGAYLTTDIPLATATLRLAARRRAGFQAAGKVLADTLADYCWEGARVTIWIGDATLTSFEDWLERFHGTVQSVVQGMEDLTLAMLQEDEWNRPLNLRVVAKATEPQAPEEAMGQTFPIILGEVSDTPYRSPFPPHPLAEHSSGDESLTTGVNKLRGGRRTGGAILVDTGRGGEPVNAKARVMIASHKCKAIMDYAKGLGLFLETDGKLVAVEPRNLSVTGSSFYAWVDWRGTFRQVYVQKLDPEGVPLWTAEGVLVSASTAAVTTMAPKVISDTLGGCWVAWSEDRGSSDDIYVNHLNAAGVPAWSGGRALCTAGGDQGAVDLVLAPDPPGWLGDPMGGVLVAWQDTRPGSNGIDLYCQRISQKGVVPVLSWPANGQALCTFVGDQTQVRVCSDDAAGLIAVWRDARSGAVDIYAQRVNGSGVVQWTAQGILVCGHGSSQENPTIVKDGAGGCWAAWDDWVGGTNDIYLVRLTSAGAVASGWTANGLQVSAGVGNHGPAKLIQDEAGGCLLAWWELVGTQQIRIQRYDGNAAAKFAVGGVLLGSAGGSMPTPPVPAICPDESGGAVVAWLGPANTIVAQRVNATGARLWNSGAAVTVASGVGTVNPPRVASDGSGGCIITWTDNRSGGAAHDVYAQRLDRSGALLWPVNGIRVGGAPDTQVSAQLAGAGDGDLINDSVQGAGVLLADNAGLMWFGAAPASVEFVTNSAENPRAILDPWNDLNYVKLDYAAGQRELRFFCESPSDLGEMTAVYYVVAYRAPAAVNLRFRAYDTSSGEPNPYIDSALPATGSAPIKVRYGEIGIQWGIIPLPAAPWGLGAIRCSIGWFGVGGDAGTAEIYFANLAVRHISKQEMLASARVISHTETRPVIQRRGKGSGPRTGTNTIYLPYEVHETLPAITELRGKFFANAQGWMDDAVGSISGAPYALIEDAPGILALLLRKYGLEAQSKITTGTGVFGSFSDARAKLFTPRRTPPRFGLNISEPLDLLTAAAWIMESSTCWLYRSEFDRTWKVIVWEDGAAPDFRRVLRRDDVLEDAELRAERTPRSQRVSTVRVAYGWDAASRGYRHEVVIGATRSQSGHEYRNLRGEYLSVVAGVNDKLDVRRSAVHTAVLTPGSYVPLAAAQMATTALTAAGGGIDYAISWGSGVLNGFNDTIRFFDGVAAHVVTMPAAEYATLEDEVAALTAAMTAVSPGWIVSYNRTLRKVTIDRAAPHKTGNELLYTNGTPIAQRRLYAALGFDITIETNPTTLPAQASQEREEERYSLAASPVVDLLPETGPNGLKGTRTAGWELFGFDSLRDLLAGGAISSWLAPCPKNNREQPLAGFATKYKRLQRDVSIDGRAIYDTDTARWLCALVAQFLGESRVLLVFASEALADLERGRVITFLEDLDDILVYPKDGSSGSWAGKPLRVIETELNFGLTWYTEVVAVES